jgi:hypothetical protein
MLIDADLESLISGGLTVMLRKYLAIAVLALCSAPLFADVILDTSIADVFNRGSNELAGSITMTVNNDDFADASTLEPIFIRVTPDHKSKLAETLVDQNRTDFRADPIYLAMKLNSTSPVFELLALPETVSIVRWVEGETSFWIQVQTSSDTWIGTGGVPLDGTPNDDATVSWTLGISARASDNLNPDWPVKSNLPFNTRDSATTGLVADSTSTLFCVDLALPPGEPGGLDTIGFESLLQYDIISFDFRADLGNGFYSANTGVQTGINFTNDFRIARGKARECTVEVQGTKFAPGVTRLCVPAAVGNGGIEGLVKATNVISYRIRCNRGGDLLTTELVPGSYFSFDNGSRGLYGFLSGNDARFGEVGFDGNFVPNGLGSGIVSGPFAAGGGNTLYAAITLFWEGDVLSLIDRTITIQVCTWYYFGNPPITATLDYAVVLVNHEGAEDDPPYDGIDQHIRCLPSEFVIATGTWDQGEYVPCTGVPTVLFFPYLPRLFDTNFWTGISYVNQGGVDFDAGGIEIIFYAENGDCFSATPDLPLPVRNQMTWLLREDELGTVGLFGAGVNNADVTVIPEPCNGADPTAFGQTRMSMFIVGSFEAEFLDDVFNGDLDGYLLVGDYVTGSVDGAYLPRNYDNDIPGQNADLPIRRSKRANDVLQNVPIDSTRASIYPPNLFQ